MTATEWMWWVAFERVEPFGELAADLRSAQIAALVYNANRGRGRALSARDFLLSHAGRERQDPDAWWAQFRAAHALMGGGKLVGRGHKTNRRAGAGSDAPIAAG